MKRAATKHLNPVSMTTAEAARRYPGVEERYLQRMCLKGKRLKRVYGDQPPVKEINSALFAKKVGKYWLIPVEELKRVFT